MILVIVFSLVVVAIVGALIYGVQKRKKNLPLAVPEVEVEQLVAKLKKEVKAATATKPAKMSAKPKKPTTKVTKTK